MKRLTTDEFIVRAKQVHGDTYDYSLVKYTGTHKKVTIICFTHGEFEKTPHNHLLNQGCPTCSKLAYGEKVKLSQHEFIERSKKIHSNVYNYDKVQYTHSQVKVIINCSIHGDFTQEPSEHLRGRGCPKCGDIASADSTRKDRDTFIKEAKSVHGTKYDYTNTVYVSANTKLSIVCSEHEEFHQTPNSHLGGSGCPGCANYGFDQTKPAYLYYLKITTDEGKILYKIGITNRSVNERFQLYDLVKIEIVKQDLYDLGKDALRLETDLKRRYSEYQYKGPDILNSGNTELFTVDIMSLYNEPNLQ